MTRGFDRLKHLIKGTVKESARRSHHVLNAIDRYFVTMKFYYMILYYYRKLFVNL